MTEQITSRTKVGMTAREFVLASIGIVTLTTSFLAGAGAITKRLDAHAIKLAELDGKVVIIGAQLSEEIIKQNALERQSEERRNVRMQWQNGVTYDLGLLADKTGVRIITKP